MHVVIAAGAALPMPAADTGALGMPYSTPVALHLASQCVIAINCAQAATLAVSRLLVQGNEGMDLLINTAHRKHPG